jgi:hypothetical protein
MMGALVGYSSEKLQVPQPYAQSSPKKDTLGQYSRVRFPLVRDTGDPEWGSSDIVAGGHGHPCGCSHQA